VTGKVALSLLVAALPVLADFDVAQWRNRRAVHAPAACLAAFEIDDGVYAASQPGLADLRLTIGSSELPYTLVRLPERRESALGPTRSEDRAARATVLTARAFTPFDAVRIDTSAPAFDRRVEISVSPDGDKWTYAGSGPIYRTPAGQRLEVLLTEQQAPWVRLRIFNRDDRPLPISRIYLGRPAVRLLFAPSGAGPHWLYYGNRRARSPEYDFARTLPTCEPAPATLSAPEKNPDYRPPWTEGGRWALYTALIVAVLALGAVIVRFWTVLRTNTLSS
jgi:hypothetical protein